MSRMGEQMHRLKLAADTDQRRRESAEGVAETAKDQIAALQQQVEETEATLRAELDDERQNTAERLQVWTGPPLHEDGGNSGRGR